MKNYALLLTLITLLYSTPLWSLEIAGVELPEEVSLQPQGVALQLNGAGVRKKLFFDIYIGALYTGISHNSLESINGDPGAKRILMHFLYDEVSRKKLNQGWLDGFDKNLTELEYTALKADIDAFTAIFPDMRKGDEIWLDNLPGQGTRISINGDEAGLIRGDTFFPALLKIWLGQKPVTEKLKKAMLGLD